MLPCVVLKHYIGGAVITLLLWRSPAAIVAVVAIGVLQSVKGMLFTWRHSHIFDEVINGLFPTLAYRYAFTSVVTVGSSFLIVAAIEHTMPDVVDTSSRKPVFELFGVLASTRSDIAIEESVTSNNVLVTTGTLATPRRVRTLTTRPCNHGKVTKGLSGDVL